MKKSIAVLSLTIAGALGLAACGGNSGTNSSPSASATASASTSAAAETTKAETKTTQGTISAPSGLPNEASEALKKEERGIQPAGNLRTLQRQQGIPERVQGRSRRQEGADQRRHRLLQR